MKTRTALLAAIIFCAICPAGYAMYEVADEGTWPESWPAELEPLRKQAQTYVGPMVESRHYLIPFTQREQFEAAWGHFLKIKSKAAPIILVRGPKTDFMKIEPAGVLIHTPPIGSSDAEKPLAGDWSNPRAKWMKTTFIELVVDGTIVDLNRIALPADTPIIDERFEDADKKQEDKKAPEQSDEQRPPADNAEGSPPASITIDADQSSKP